MKVEVCVTSVASARIAEAAGADRLELCAELAFGGVTPSAGLLLAVRDVVEIPVHVLVRKGAQGLGAGLLGVQSRLVHALASFASSRSFEQ